MTKSLPLPMVGDETTWVRTHLASVCRDEPVASPRFRGTQAAADAGLSAFDVTGYANRRNDVYPVSRRGASGLSPWIRHGHLSLPTVWSRVKGPARDLQKFRDELLWQEYARHLYARIGSKNAQPIRYQPYAAERSIDPWNRSMACVDAVLQELESDGWLVNQTRMWMASQWAVRHGATWHEGEEVFFQHLLDGSRAANRLGWQWTIGAGTGKPYGFSQWQVTKRAPGLCAGCIHRQHCPIEEWPPDRGLSPVNSHEHLRAMSDPESIAGPRNAALDGDPTVVWITAESLGDNDPALTAHPELPVMFVFDEVLLARLQLSGKRLIFLTERLAELANTRDLMIVLGDPAEALRSNQVAATYAPVPGWRRLARSIKLAAIYPWPWLRQPNESSVASFSAWRDGGARRT